MHEGTPEDGQALAVGENISGTIAPAKSHIEGSGEREKAAAELEDSLGCLFIAADSWPAGYPPFCGQPPAPGSAYCASHRARCRRVIHVVLAEKAR